MLTERRNCLIQAIVPNVEDYLYNVDCFYQQKIQFIMQKIKSFIDIAQQLTEVPQHLVLQFSQTKTIAKATSQQKQVQKLMVKDEIQKFINLKTEVIEYQTGNKYLYPQLPKIQRNLNRRKYSKENQQSMDSQKNQSEEMKQSINQICNLLGTLDLESKTNQQICDSIENMVAQMNELNLSDKNESNQIILETLKQQISCQTQLTEFEQKAIQLQNIRKRKKIQLFKFSSYLSQDEQQLVQKQFSQIFQEKLSLIKQLFKTHLQNSVQQVIKNIEKILLKALNDIKKHQKAYVPIHKISSYFYKLNIKFYRSQGVIKCLSKYLTKKIKQCIIDNYQTFNLNGQEIKIKTNFRLRFFKHILLENIFFIWLKHAVIDMNKMVKDNLGFDERKLVSSRKIECQNSPQKDKEDHRIHNENQYDDSDIFSERKDSHHSFDNFIM